MASRVQPATQASQEAQEPAEGACGLNPEIARLRGDAEVARLRLEAAHAEIERLRLAIRRLAEQDATLSVCEGNVTVEMDATLTHAEREAIERLEDRCAKTHCVDTARILRGLLERTK